MGAEPRIERLIAEKATSLRFADLPPNVVRLAKVAVADTLGVGLAGAREPVARAAAALVTTAPRPGVATIWATGDGAAPHDAAYANGVACHSLDWDDYMHPMHGHCSAVLLPVCWALAESADADGRRFLEAFVTGYEINGLLGRVLATPHYEKGWHATSTIGVIGAAAAAARLLGLDADRTAHALGIAASHASGIRVNFGSMTKSLHAGHAAREGLAAALLARNGVTSSADWLLGPNGYLSLYQGLMGPDEAAESIAAHDFGSFVIEGPVGLVQKPYACCGSSHAAVEALISLIEENDLTPDRIDAIEVHHDPLLNKTLIHRDAHNALEGRYCLEYTMAVAAVDRAGGAEQFSDESVHRPEVRAMMAKVSRVPDRSNGPEARFAAEVVIRSGGREFRRLQEHQPGHPSRPLTEEQRDAKFAAAVRPLLGDRAIELRARIARLEQATSWRDLADLILLPTAARA
jgi:2-methylcitrate dehydratase PrpD